MIISEIEYDIYVLYSNLLISYDGDIDMLNNRGISVCTIETVEPYCDIIQRMGFTYFNIKHNDVSYTFSVYKINSVYLHIITIFSSELREYKIHNLLNGQKAQDIFNKKANLTKMEI